MYAFLPILAGFGYKLLKISFHSSIDILPLDFVVYDKDVPPLPRKFSWAEGTKQAYLSPGSPAQVYFVYVVSPVPVQVVLAV